MTNGNTKWFTLAAACLALFMAILDNLVVNVALPTISRELRASTAQLQWIVSAYTLVFASLQITAGGLGDRFGRKRWFLGGLALFTAASLFGATAGSVEMLIAARALQGIGAACIMPLTLALISAAFAPEERSRAIGIWASISISGLALGPIVGGALVQYAAWQWVFLINVPIGVVTFLFALCFVRESRDDSGQVALDIPGTLLITGAIASVTWGLIEAGERGWTDPYILAALVLAAVLLGAFIAVESRVARPMVPLGFFRSRAFTGANLVSFALSFAIAAVAFFLTLYQQNINGYTPVQAGLTILPLVLVSMAGSPFAGGLVARFGARRLITLGVLVNAVGMLLFLQADVGASYLDILPGYLVLGAGGAILNAPITTAVLNSVDVRRSGVASAVVGAVREVGAAFSIALLGTIANRVYRADYNAAGEVLAARSNPNLPEAARTAIEFVGGGASFAGRVIADTQRFPDLPEPVVALVQEASGRAFIGGMHTALLISAGVLFLMTVVSFLLIRDTPAHTTDAALPAAPPTPDPALVPGAVAALPSLMAADEYLSAESYAHTFAPPGDTAPEAPLYDWADYHTNGYDMSTTSKADTITPMHPIWEEETVVPPVEEHAPVASDAEYAPETGIVWYAPADDASPAASAWENHHESESLTPVALLLEGQANGQADDAYAGDSFAPSAGSVTTAESPAGYGNATYPEYAAYDAHLRWNGNGNGENAESAVFVEDYAPEGVGYDPTLYHPPQEAYAAQWQVPPQGVEEGYPPPPPLAPNGEHSNGQGWYAYAPPPPPDTAALAWRADALENRLAALEGREPPERWHEPVAGLDGRLAALEGWAVTAVGRDEYIAALDALTRQITALEASLTRFTRETPLRIDSEIAALERRVAQLAAELPAGIRAEWQAADAAQAQAQTQAGEAMRSRLAALEGLDAKIASQEKLDAKVSQLIGLDTRVAGLERMEPKLAEVERFTHAVPPVPWYHEQATRAEALEGRVASLEQFAQDLARRGTLARDTAAPRTEPKGRPAIGRSERR